MKGWDHSTRRLGIPFRKLSKN